jgi:hypothetical protein
VQSRYHSPFWVLDQLNRWHNLTCLCRRAIKPYLLLHMGPIEEDGVCNDADMVSDYVVHNCNWSLNMTLNMFRLSFIIPSFRSPEDRRRKWYVHVAHVRYVVCYLDNGGTWIWVHWCLTAHYLSEKECTYVDVVYCMFDFLNTNMCSMSALYDEIHFISQSVNWPNCILDSNNGDVFCAVSLLGRTLQTKW